MFNNKDIIIIRQIIVNYCDTILFNNIFLGTFWIMLTYLHAAGNPCLNMNIGYYFTLKEHQEFLTKMEISLISDKSFTMEIYENFRF